MAFEPGGYADKLGNRYEGRWIVKQLLQLLNERLLSVTVEAVGDDHHGVDLWLSYPDGRHEAQQCKARNGSHGAWSMSDLSSVLATARGHLDRRDINEFSFISAVPANMLGDLCESARQSTGDSEGFFQYQIQEVGEDRRKAFAQFCQFMGLQTGEPADRAIAYGYLRRIRAVLWADDQNSWQDLVDRAEMLVMGSGDVIVATLVQYVLTHLRSSITAMDVRQFLTQAGLHPRGLAHDGRVLPAVEELQRRFIDSIAPSLVAGVLIHREETAKVLKALEDRAVVILHGSAGCGKSGVLYEITQELGRLNRPYLPVRLDRCESPAGTPAAFGATLGLPESPAWCLEALAGGGMGVLILDQLDALRWTSAHSANALDVCRAMVREIRNMRSLGKPLGVVIACRTFDLEHDPEIKSWLREKPDQPPEQQPCRIDVGPLSAAAVKDVVQRQGRDYDAMSNLQKEILYNPQHLAMWAELVRLGEAPDFQSGIELMRRFWDNRYRELEKAGIAAVDADAVIDPLVSDMEAKGKLSVAQSLLPNRPRELDGLQSCGILSVTGGRVTFCHQSYLDFRIASRLLGEIHAGTGSVRAWLGAPAAQSLFRREQLRQVLALLQEESPADFLAAVRDLLAASAVRFHLKHLVLELLGQIDAPSVPLLAYLSDLQEDERWRDHVFETVFLGRPQYIRWLIDEGVVGHWLSSADPANVDRACWLLLSIAERQPDMVVDVIAPYADRNDEWGKRVLGCMGWHEANDSERMFELRLYLMKKGVAKDWIDWSGLAEKHPARAIRLLKAVASKWVPASLTDDGFGRRRNGRTSHLEQWTDHDLKPLKLAVAQEPALAWDSLMPHVERLTNLPGAKRRELDVWEDRLRLHVRNGYISVPRGIIELLVEAGKALAHSGKEAILSRTRPLHNSQSIITRLVLADVFPELPRDAADEAIDWLLADPGRLTLGAGWEEPEWMPAARIIEAMSPHCSDQLFARLEATLLRYHEPWNWDWVKDCIGSWKRGWFHDFWGRPQHFLLPALCPGRRSRDVEGLIGVLARKFQGYEPWRFIHGHSTGGWVGSPIPTEKLAFVSDRAWLGIVSNKEIPLERGTRWKQMGADGVAESSIRMFSRSLAGIAKRFPERFARLSLRFPADAHPEYVAAILEGVKEVKADGVPEAEKSTWRPAPVEAVVQVLDHFKLGDDRGVASDFCWLMHNRSDEDWPDRAVDRLAAYATGHNDPAHDALNCWRSDDGRGVAKADVDGLEENALNCVRGVAALAIGRLLWDHKKWLPRLKLTIERLVVDPHPVVRLAAVQACLPILNIERDFAIEAFCRAAPDDLRVAASHGGLYFFNCGIQSHHDKLSPLIMKMVDSERDDVAEEGAEEVTARWLFHGMFESQLQECIRGRLPHRKGIANVASHFLYENPYTDQCQQLLTQLFDDDDQSLLQHIGHQFRDKRVLTLPNLVAFVTAYIRSKAYLAEPSPILDALGEYQGTIVPYAELLLSACEVICRDLRDESRSMAKGIARDVDNLIPLLLRLYEQAQGQDDRAVAERCLDAWDMLFERRVGTVRVLTKAIGG